MIVKDVNTMIRSVDKMMDYLQNDVLTFPLNDALVGNPDLVGSLSDLINYRTRARDMVAEGESDLLNDLGRVIDGVHDLVCDGVAVNVGAIEGILDGILDRLKNPPIEIPEDPPIEKPDIKLGKINWGILLNIAIFDKFPFCLPKDLYSFVSILAAPPKEPVFEVDLLNGKYNGAGKIQLDFRRLEDIRKLVRSFFFILMVIGLMGATKKYIWTGGG